MSFAVASLAKGLARRATTRVMVANNNNNMIMGATTRRSVQTVPRLGTEAEMEKEAISQIRARIAYQKEVMAANPHKSHAEEWTELWTWIKISIFFVGPVVIFGVIKDLVIEEHMHRPHGALPEYMGIRKKEFPWECSDCDFFDMDCWKKCRAAKQA